MDSRTQGDDATDGEGAVISARESLALWLRTGRAGKKLSVEDVAKITKIQPRILEKLERGELEGLPAEVFVKGFVRSFAKCVGLDEQEALVRYGACKSSEAAATPTARALVESMGLARKAQGTPAKPTPVVAAPVEPVVETIAEVVIETPAIEPVIETPVIETVAAAPIDVAPIAAAQAPLTLPVEAVSIEPGVETPVVEAASTESIEAAPSEPKGKTKRSRKKSPTNGAPRSRKKKGALSIEVNLAPAIDANVAVALEAPSTNDIAPPVGGIGVAMHAVDEDAYTAQIVTVSLDTGPVVKIDGESLITNTIEAKPDRMDDAIVVASMVDAPDAPGAIELNDGSVEMPRFAEGSERISSSQIEVVDVSGIALDDPDNVTVDTTAGTWQPTMPPIASTPSVPWRRPHITASRTYVVPTLVIDDADPDSADREREDRAEKDHSRLSFLPPILLDREDRSSRQGGLTLAVIILLIAATLTLSYLMRRPSASGDGVTIIDTHGHLIA